jgi:hypothetical protein
VTLLGALLFGSGTNALNSLKDQPDVYVLNPENYKEHLSQCHEDEESEPHCMWFVLFHKGGEDPVPVFEEAAKDFHGKQLVHMALFDHQKYPSFMKSVFTAKLRETPSLVMFHKGHMVSHWNDHHIHKGAHTDVLKDFNKEDFFRSSGNHVFLC